MEQQTTSETEVVTTRSAGIRFGLISGVIGIAMFVIFNIAGINMTSGPWQFLGWFVTAAIIFFAHKYYKENATDGFMSYGQGVGIAFWVGIISSVISSVFMFVYIKFIDAGFLEMIKEKQISDMEAKGMSADQIDQAVKMMSMFTSPLMMLIFGIVFGIIGAVIIGLLVTIFTKKANPETSI